MMLLRTHTFTGLFAFVTLAMAPSGVHAQGTFVDCSSTNSFTSIANPDNLLTEISTLNTQVVSLPFDFPFFDGDSFNQVRVTDNIDFTTPIVGTHFDVAFNDLFDAQNVYYQQNGINSVVFSWEDFNFIDAEVNNNAQVTFFSNGDLTICYGSGDTNGRGIFAALLSSTSPNLNVNVAPFTNGFTNNWPTDLCVCFDAGSATLNPTTAEPSKPPSLSPSAQPSVSPSATPSAQPSFSPSAQPSSSPSAQPTVSSEPTITECLSRSTKSPGKGKGKGGKKTTKTASPTGCLETKSPGKGKGKMRRRGGKGKKQ